MSITSIYTSCTSVLSRSSFPDSMPASLIGPVDLLQLRPFGLVLTQRTDLVNGWLLLLVRHAELAVVDRK